MPTTTNLTLSRRPCLADIHAEALHAVQWAFSLSSPSEKRGSSNQHTPVTIGFTDKLTADRWHAKASEALCVFQQRDQPDLSAQSMSVLQRATLSKGESLCPRQCLCVSDLTVAQSLQHSAGFGRDGMPGQANCSPGCLAMLPSLSKASKGWQACQA